MVYEKYKELVDKFYQNDNREVNYQNRVIIPFLEELLGDEYDVVDSSQLTKQWNERNINRDKFAGDYTPDLLVAKNWVLRKECEDNSEILIVLEIKSPTATDRKHSENEIEEYRSKDVSGVILTDCVTWEFYNVMTGEEKKNYLEKSFLEKERRTYHYRKGDRYKEINYTYPCDVCKRKQPLDKKVRINWDDCDKEWLEICDKIKDFAKAKRG